MKNLLLLFTLLVTINCFGQIPSYVPTDSLVGWYPFNGNANDESGNGNNGTVNGASLDTNRFGDANSAYDFDGIDDYSGKSAEEIFAWNEFHKWNFKLSWYTRLVENLVLNTRVQFGFLGRYNSKLDVTPFERFSLGGSGLSGFTLYGTQVVALRGYPDNSLSPTANGGSTIYNKFTFEMRYPLSLNPSATIYGLAFLEAGNAWNEIDNFEPFNVRRSAGLGVRIFLPMFGLLGCAYRDGFDIEGVPGFGAQSSKWQPYFIIGYSVE